MALLSPPLPVLTPARHSAASYPLLAAAASTTASLSLSPQCRGRRGALCRSGPNGRPLRRRRWGVAASVEQEESGSTETSFAPEGELEPPVSSEQVEASPEDLENIREVKRVLELLQKNRDMTFGEVKLTIMIEDPRDIERKRTLGIEDPDDITRDDLADALVEVNEGRIPENRVALQLLAKEMAEWPDLEVEAPKGKGKPGKSIYAKATDTGIDPEIAAKRLNIDWDSAADIDGEEDEEEETEVPSAVGYGALYLLTAFPVIIGISVSCWTYRGFDKVGGGQSNSPPTQHDLETAHDRTMLMCAPPFREANSISRFCSRERTAPASAMSLSQQDASSGESPSSFKKEDRVGDDEEEEVQAVARAPIGQPSRAASSVTYVSSNGSINYRKARRDRIGSNSFWCGALRCMHLPLPGLSRRRTMQQQQSMSISEVGTLVSTARPGDTRASRVSKVASMERFKYSSSSSGIVFERGDAEEEEEEEEEEEVSAYFDLPLELLRISSVDTESPVTTAFLFDGNRGRGAKKIVPEVLDLDFSFPEPPAFSSLSSPGSERSGAQ
ncbi:hypothetical protein EJB05_16670, partial [Eragrostis curvula]